MSLAEKWADHPQAHRAWKEANFAIKGLMIMATGGDDKLAEKLYGELPEAFMNQLVDDLHKLFCMTFDEAKKPSENVVPLKS